MVGELIMLPLRVGVRATRLWLRVAEEAASIAASATGRVIELAASRGSDAPSVTTVPPSERRADPESDRSEKPSRQVSETASRQAEETDIHAQVMAALDRESPEPVRLTRREPRQTSIPQRPTHVSEEPELVEEFSEPGAEDGAGAEVHVEEPWEGYSQMNAKQVISRLSMASPAALAAVALYENTHRRRQTIVNAVDRQLRSSNGSNSQRKQRG